MSSSNNTIIQKQIKYIFFNLSIKKHQQIYHVLWNHTKTHLICMRAVIAAIIPYLFLQFDECWSYIILTILTRNLKMGWTKIVPKHFLCEVIILDCNELAG